MVASTMAYSMSGSSDIASNSRLPDIRLHPIAEAREDTVPVAKRGRQVPPGTAGRAIHSTASTNSLLSLPLRPGSPGLPRQSGSIFAHWASVKTNRSIRSLNHNQAQMRS